MNKLIKISLILFLSFFSLFISLGFLLKINYYQDNTIVENSLYEKVILSNDTYEILKNNIKKKIFYYYENDNEKKQKILAIKEYNSYTELYLEPEKNHSGKLLIQIKYFLYKKSYWNSLF